MIVTLAILAFLVFVVLNIPISVALGLSALLWVLLKPGVSVVMIAQKMFTGLDSFPLLAIPLFMLAGELMNRSTIAKRLVDFSDVLVGSLKGGLSHVLVVVCMFFGGITGSSTSETSAIGSLLIPAMIKEGYERDIAVALTATASVIGVIIPPSIPIIFYAITRELSIAGMLLSGFLPGILLGLCLMGVNAYFAHTRNYKKHPRPSLKEAIRVSKRALSPLSVAVIIVVGIYGGIFTPTEAAAVAAVYIFFLGFFVYRDMTLKEVWSLIVSSSVVMAVSTFLISTTVAFSYAITVERIPEMLVAGIWGITHNKVIILLMLNLALLVIGCFMPGIAAILIFAPVFGPIGDALGMHPFTFGMMFVLNISIGFITPPVGPCLYMACAIGRIEMAKTIRALLPYFFASCLALLLVTFVPFLTTWLPSVILK
jgi:C4-dicarboxylate transporter DctM subunit